MGNIRINNIKNRNYYFYNDQINLKDFDPNMLKINKKNYKEIDVYYIGYVNFKEIANCNNINSVNPLYLMINEMIGHFEEKMKISIQFWMMWMKTKKFQKNMKKFGKVLKKKLKRLMVAKKLNMGKIFKKLGLSLMTICH